MKVGEIGVISEIQGGENYTKRLSTLGIVVGANIKKLSQQALRGPVVVGVGRSKIAIGFSLAKKIVMEVELAFGDTENFGEIKYKR